MDSKSAALKSLNQRRDYGAQPTAACISKSIERALREEGRVQQPSRNAPGNELDALDWTEEEEWACEMPDEEDAWRPQRVATMLGAYAQGHHQATTAAILHKQQESQQQQPSAAAQQANIQHSNEACLKHASSLQSCSLHSDSIQQHAHTLSGQGLQQPDPDISSYEQQPRAFQPEMLPQTVVAVQHSTVASAGGVKASAAFADVDAAQVTTDASQRGAADPQRSSLHALSEPDNAAGALQLAEEFQGPQQAQALQTAADVRDSNCAAPGTSMEASHMAENMHNCASSEQSDYELALRLQEQENVLVRQQSRSVGTGRVGVKQKPRKASVTLHAFFKKA